MRAVVDGLYLIIGDFPTMQAFLWKSRWYRCSVMSLSNVNNKQFKPTRGEPSGERDTLHMEVTWGLACV